MFLSLAVWLNVMLRENDAGKRNRLLFSALRRERVEFTEINKRMRGLKSFALDWNMVHKAEVPIGDEKLGEELSKSLQAGESVINHIGVLTQNASGVSRIYQQNKKLTIEEARKMRVYFGIREHQDMLKLLWRNVKNHAVLLDWYDAEYESNDMKINNLRTTKFDRPWWKNDIYCLA